MRHLIEALLVYSQVREFSTRSEIVDLKSVSTVAVESIFTRASRLLGRRWKSRIPCRACMEIPLS